jgi:hypothetical protein
MNLRFVESVLPQSRGHSHYHYPSTEILLGVDSEYSAGEAGEGERPPSRQDHSLGYILALLKGALAQPREDAWPTYRFVPLSTLRGWNSRQSCWHSPQPQLRPEKTLYCSDPNCEHCQALKKALQEMQGKFSLSGTFLRGRGPYGTPGNRV